MSAKPTTPPRHCMVVFAPYPIGETRVQREAEALIRHGYEVDVISTWYKPTVPQVDTHKGVTVYRVKSDTLSKRIKTGPLGQKFLGYMVFILTAGFRLTQLHFKKHYQSIQVHNMPDFLVLCALIPKLLGVPIILDMHDLMPEFYAARYGSEKSFLHRLIRLQEKLSCRFANHVITVTEQWRQALIKRGLPPEKCLVVMNVADEAIFHPSERWPYHPHNGKCFRMVYHGALVERNGVGLAIQAVDKVRREIPGIHLDFIGYGDYIPEMKQMVAELGLEEHVSIEGMHLAEELPEIIMSCHLGIVPIKSSVFTDTALSTKLMEYAALGMPAVVARTPANEMYFCDTNSEFFEPGSADDMARAIIRLYHDPRRVEELARGGRNFTQRYSWATISANYTALVDRLGGRLKAR